MIVDGGAHGWWIEPSTTSQTLTLSFTPQRTLNVALALSALFVMFSVIIAVRTRRTSRTESQIISSPPQLTPTWNVVAAVATNLCMMLALFDARTAIWTSAVLAVVLWTRTQKILSSVVAGVFTIAMGTSWWESLTTSLPLDFGWPRSTQASHHTLLACLVMLAVLCLVRPHSATPKEQSHPLA